MKARTLLAVGAVLLFGALVRVYSLDHESLWMDEAWSLWAVSGGAVSDTLRAVAADAHPPFYFLLLDGWTALAGDSEFAGRALSAFFGLLTVALVYRTAREMFSPAAGVMAALVAAASGYLAYYARELRMYTLVALLATASVFFYRRWLRGGPGARRAAVGYVAATGLLVYTHYFGVFVLLAVSLHFLIVLRQHWRRIPAWMLLHAGVVAAFEAWLPVTLRQFGARPGGLDQATPTSPELVHYLADVFTDAQPVLYAGLIALALLQRPRRDRTPVSITPLSWTALLALWAVLPPALALLFNTRYPVLTVQNVIVAAPPVATLAGLGLSRLPATPRAVFAALVILAGLTPTGLLQEKSPWRAFVGEIAARYEPGDVTFLHIGGPPLWSMPFAYYYARQLPDAAPPVNLFDLPGPPSARVFADAIDDLTAGRRAWVVLTHTTAVTSYALPLLEQSRAPSLIAAMGDHRAYLYQRTDAPAGFYFGDAPDDGLHLIDCELPDDVFLPGGILDVTLAWQVDRQPQANYSTGVYLLGEDGGPVESHLGFPGGERTSSWQPGQTYTDPHEIILPPDLPPGYYSVVARALNVFRDETLPVHDAAGVPLGEYAVLGGITVTALSE